MKTTKSRRTPSIPYLRRRLQKSGKTYYYLEVPVSANRGEIALGDDYSVALAKREQLLLVIRLTEREESNNLLFVLDLYKEIVIPTLERKKQRENLRTMGNLLGFFRATSYSFNDIESPDLHESYSIWRSTKATARVKNELSFLRRLRNLALQWKVLEDFSEVDACKPRSPLL
jgi:hypothetical protein